MISGRKWVLSWLSWRSFALWLALPFTPNTCSGVAYTDVITGKIGIYCVTTDVGTSWAIGDLVFVAVLFTIGQRTLVLVVDALSCPVGCSIQPAV